MISTNLKLYTLTFIDSVCLGVLPPIMAARIMSLGGNHVTLGIFGSMYALAQLISGTLIYSWNGLLGKKGSFLCSLLIYCITYMWLGFTSSCFVFIMLRACYALTNQTQLFCKSVAASVNTAEITESVTNVLNIVGVTGLIVGPIIGGALYEFQHGFFYITSVASLLLGLSFYIGLTLPSPSAPTETTTFIKKLDEDVVSIVRKLQAVNFNKYMYVILLKALYTGSLTIFFIKFSFALKLNQGLTFTVTGLTYAYQSLITFLSTFMINYFNPTLDETTFVRWLCILSVSLCILCNTSSYLLYVITFVAMAVSHGVLTRLFKQLFVVNKIADVEVAVSKVTSLIVPVIFGVACNSFGLTALNAFVILPIFCDIFIMYGYLKISTEQEDETPKSEDKKKE